MAFTRSLLLLATLFFGAESQVAKTCPKAPHIIAARGHGTPAGYGGLNLTVQAIQAAIKGTTTFPVPYYTNGMPSYNFQAEVMNGTGVMEKNFFNYTTSCPSTPVILMGYSEGADVMMNMLCGASSQGFTPTQPIASSYAMNVIAVIIFGDETRTRGQSYNVGTCTTGQGGFPRYNPGGCSAFAPVMQSYCDTPDPECCGGNNETVHHIYPQVYDSAVVSYVTSQYSSWRVAHPITKSSVTSTTATSSTTSTTSSSTITATASVSRRFVS